MKILTVPFYGFIGKFVNLCRKTANLHRSMAPYIDFHTHRRRGGAVEILNVDLLDEGELSAAIVGAAPFTLGVHPWRADAGEERLSEAYERLVECSQLDNFVAVGECGLDWLAEVDRVAQIRVFEQQLRLAKSVHRTVVLHCVKAFEQMMSMLRNESVERAVFHSFIGSVQQMERVVSSGYLCSFSPRSLGSSRTCEVIRQIPSSAILIESDESDTRIEEIYEEVAALRGCSVEELADIVFDNYKRLITNE